MQLTSITLAGFKSFVDQTKVPVPGQLMAIVGPNGCGKSNIIDAVRWVMGESSAKQLRGESMTDVIFNGSTTRKEVGQASIELHFDNSEGKLGGAYAQYNEIVIRRQVTRAGQSDYFLNGTHCRRRDITDLFLGTGLGPRSYAIIEQGTISRLIEAKPDELRVYLEEAAGISKYKERRRETELRMQHTRDNLARLEDIRGELGKQLEHLQKQAATAERYQGFKEQEQTLRAQLLVLRWITVGQQLQEQQQLISQHELQLEEVNTQLTHFNAERETLHVQQNESNEQVQEVQQRYYQLNTELARLEQTIQHQRERQQQLQNEYRQAESAYQEAQLQLAQEQENAQQIAQQLIELEPQVTAASETVAISRSALVTIEQEMHEWQTRWDEFNQQAATSVQRAQVEQTRIQHLEQRLQQTQQRLNKIIAEQQLYKSGEIPEAITQLEASDEELAEQIAAQQNQLGDLQTRLNNQRDQNKHSSQTLDTTRGQIQSLRGRSASLTALQEAALGKTSAAVVGWLQNQQLQDNARLAQCIQVDQGWECAVETVLGDHLEAVCVSGLSQVTAALEELTQGTLTVVYPQQSYITQNNGADIQNSMQCENNSDPQSITSFENNSDIYSATQQENNSEMRTDIAHDLNSEGQSLASSSEIKTTLLSKVQSQYSIEGLFSGVYCVDTLNEALKLLPQLRQYESIITRDGIWLGHGWLRVARDADEKAGVIQRERELSELLTNINTTAELAENLQAQLEEGQLQLRNLEDDRDRLQRGLNQLFAKQSDIRAQLRIQLAQLEQQQQRVAHLAREAEELQQQFQIDQDELGTVRTAWQEMLLLMEKDTEMRNELMIARDECRTNLDAARQEARLQQEQAHQLTMQLQVLQTQRNAVEQLQMRLQQQLTQMGERQTNIQTQLEDIVEPHAELERQLTTLLDARQGVEHELRIARQHYDEFEQKSRDCEKQKQLAEQRAMTMRNELEQYRLTRQTAEVRRTTLQEQLTESGFAAEEVKQQLPEEATESEWEEQLTKTLQRIERLGPINLAAISEYATQAERKNYLDAQHEDLITALTTLEDAIRKIDHETRERFKEVYEEVNNRFKALFPKVFGGGQAYLELLGEDLLDTGVSVIARPPGKKNSTIHLLSGGEKALTAIALVFAIFQLNPAPFCMLDEVDAPLDDANIARFCELVKEMSKTIKFIFISHNKLAMEMADHLTGVTMHEPGVSRLVAVDVHAAIEMATA